MSWFRSELCARGFLDASMQRSDFMGLRIRLSWALESSRVENTTSTLRNDTDGDES